MGRRIYRSLWVAAIAVLAWAPGAYAAFPQVAATSGDGLATGTTDHVLTLPSGIVSGSLVVCLLSIRDSDPTDPTWPAGWTQVAGGTNYVGQLGNIETRYRFADGTEGASITVTSSAATASAYQCFRFTGHHASSAPEATVSGKSSSANPDPPSLTPSWGALDTLWIAATGFDSGGSGANITAYPSNYSNGVEQIEAVQVGLGTARRELNATSDDPGTFTLDAADTQVAATIAIRPAAATSGALMLMGIGN